MMLKIKQIGGLYEALSGKIDDGQNIGTIGTGLYAGKSNGKMQFARLYSGVGFAPFAIVNGVLTLNLNTGTGGDQIVQLTPAGKLPAINGEALTGLNADSLISGTVPLGRLGLPLNNLYLGTAGGIAARTPAGSIPISLFGPAIGNINLQNFAVTTSAVSWLSNHLVPRSYVDSAYQGFKYRQSVKTATVNNINLASPGISIDNYDLTIGDRVLVKAQTNPAQNGIYIWNGSVVPMTRAPDYTTPDDISQTSMYIEGGLLSAFQIWRLLGDPGGPPIIVGTTPLNYSIVGSVSSLEPGDGLERIGNGLLVKGDNNTIGRVAGKVSVVSSDTLGETLLSVGTDGVPAVWGKLNIANTNAITGVLAQANGGTGFTALEQHSLLGAFTGTAIEPLSVTDNTVIGKLAGGNVQPLDRAALRVLLKLRPVMDTGLAVSGNMVLLTLSQVPDDVSKVLVWYNGVLMRVGADYTITGQTVSATAGFNIELGGTASDGLGFTNSPRIVAFYTY